MKNKANIKIDLTADEKLRLKSNKIKISDIFDYSVDELIVLLNVPENRAKEISALMEFQTIKSIGKEFAKDLVFMGYYSINELKDKDPAKLLDEYELAIGAWIDPCVEDQFRLVVNYANCRENNKNWWDFTQERKLYRSQNGYPDKRPKKAWYETEKYTKKMINEKSICSA
jgi:hypothetical protein